MKKALKELIGKELLFFDGGMGSTLQKMGLVPGEVPEDWNIDHPDRIGAVQRGYMDAGSNIIQTNTFGANRIKMTDSKYSLEETITAAFDIADKERKECGRDDIYIALDIGPTGKLMEPLGTLSFDEAYEAFKEVVLIGNKLDIDAVTIQTMTSEYEVKAAVLAAKENLTRDIPIIPMVMVDERGKLLSGTDITAITALLEGLGVDAMGFNCGFGPDMMLPFVKELTDVASIPCLVLPNAGLPMIKDGETVFPMSPSKFADCMEEIFEAGPWLLGGCCGTTKDHIGEMIKRLKGRTQKPVTDKGLSIVSSSTKGLILRGSIVIGERMNPTGKKALSEAYRNEDMSYVMDLAIDQEEKGAEALALNLGLPEIDEVTQLTKTCRKVQGVTDAALMLDTTNPEAMERVVRYYHGKPIINSVNAKEEVMKDVFPIVAKYGGIVIGLTIDEAGIPDTAEGRCALAKRIIDEGAKYGIAKKDILIDPLCLTVSVDNEAAKLTLDSLEMIHKELGVHTVLGVSNVSFGMPNRSIINCAFYQQALERGLTCGIINPSDEKMMAIARGAKAEIELDFENFDATEYVKNYGTVVKTVKIEEDESNPAEALKKKVYHYLVEGIDDGVRANTAKLLDYITPMEAINDVIIPGLDFVGAQYEEGTYFLPQLLMSAGAATAAFDVIKERFGGGGGNRGTFIIATVKGDIHDIGKNIVKVLLENYDFNVIDLGKDVPPEDIAAAVKEHDCKALGLSALMTTTVPFMEETIKLVRAQSPDCKVIVGGAVLNEEVTSLIGADAYGKDAMATVHFAEKILG